MSSSGGQRGMAPGLPMAGGLQEASLQAEFHPLCLIQQVGGGMAGDRGCIQQGELACVALGAELQPAGRCPPGCPLVPLCCRAAARLSPHFPPTRRCLAGSRHTAGCLGVHTLHDRAPVEAGWVGAVRSAVIKH